MMITCQGCLCDCEHHSWLMSSVGFLLPLHINRATCVCVCCGFYGLNTCSICMLTFAVTDSKRKPEDQWCRAVSLRTEIIRKRIWFISPWKEGYLPPWADSPFTSKGAPVLWSTTRSRRCVEQCSEYHCDYCAPHGSCLCLCLWTPALEDGWQSSATLES